MLGTHYAEPASTSTTGARASNQHRNLPKTCLRPQRLVRSRHPVRPCLFSAPSPLATICPPSLHPSTRKSGWLPSAHLNLANNTSTEETAAICSLSAGRHWPRTYGGQARGQPGARPTLIILPGAASVLLDRTALHLPLSIARRWVCTHGYFAAGSYARGS